MRSRADGNQADIVAALRKIGCSVQSLTSVGRGCPDLLVGCNGRNVLLEVKADKCLLRAIQAVWRSNWRGHAVTVRTVDEALAAVREEAL